MQDKHLARRVKDKHIFVVVGVAGAGISVLAAIVAKREVVAIVAGTVGF